MTTSRTGPVTPSAVPAMTLILVPLGVRHLGDLGAGHAPVARVHHLVGGRQVGPELEAVHRALRVALGHLLVDDAAAGGHPLHVARGDDAAVAQAVAVLDVAAQDVGDGLDAAVGMPGEALEVVVGLVRAEVVEQQERVVQLAGRRSRWPGGGARRRPRSSAGSWSPCGSFSAFQP